MPHWVCGTHADGPTGGFGGASYGAAKRCAGLVKMPNWVCGTQNRRNSNRMSEKEKHTTTNIHS
eukprot:6901852-Pyramimonas_sp.AAC.1